MKQDTFAREMGISQQRVSKLEKQKSISRKYLEAAAMILNVSVDTFERFDEDGLLHLATEAKPEEVTRSVKEVIDYFKEELSKKEKKIEELESRLNTKLVDNDK